MHVNKDGQHTITVKVENVVDARENWQINYYAIAIVQKDWLNIC